MSYNFQASVVGGDEDEEEAEEVFNPFAFGSGDLLSSSGDDAVIGDDGDGATEGSGNFTLDGDEEEEGEDDEEVRKIYKWWN